MGDVLKKVPVREQEPKVRAKNFDEVCLGYNKEEAIEEANRCLNCKNAQCIKGCPVAINIPAFIEQVKTGNVEEAYKVISESSALPAVCGRVCPQESQCEGKCIRGIKGEPVSIGKLERFVADTAREMGIKPEGANRAGRFAGRIVQLQNLPQNHIETLSEARELLKSFNLEALKVLYEDIPDTLSQLIRTAFIPKSGYKFIVCDYAAIEARVLAWLAGETWRIEAFERGDDIYCASAYKNAHSRR